MEKKKRVFIVHGWASSSEDCWLPWIKKELEKIGFIVIAPDMSDPKTPNISIWTSILSDLVMTPDEDTYFIGHSMGCFIILKYLESLTEKDRIGGVICVGGRLGKDGWPPLNTEKIKRFAPRVKAIFSDNDYYVPLSVEEAYREWGAKTLILNNSGHFSRKESITKLPEARDALLELASSRVIC